MKTKNYFFLIFILFLSFNSFSQTPVKRGHTLLKISSGNDLEGALSYCGEKIVSNGNPRRLVNITSTKRLEIDQMYGLDFGEGFNYYYVLYAKDSRWSDEDENITITTNIEPICSTNPYRRAHLLMKISNSLEGAKAKCGVFISDDGSAHKVNIRSTNKLQVDRIYKLDFGEGLNYYYVLFAGDSRYSDEDSEMNLNSNISPLFCDQATNYHVIKYRGSTKDIANDSKCNNKSETSVGINITGSKLNVGQIYWIDRGTGIGFRYYEIISSTTGANASVNTIPSTDVTTSFIAYCAPPPAGKADLYVDEIASNIMGECGSTFPCNESYKNAKTHRYSLYNDQSNYLNLATVVGNKGDASSGSNKVNYYLSLDNKIDANDFTSDKISNLGSLSPNTSTTIQEALSLFNFRKNGSNPSASNYNLIIEIKVDDKDNSNNTFTIPVRVTAKSNSTISTSPQNPNTSNNTESYKIDIYDFSGTFLKSVKINASMNDKELMNGMPSGLYILKNSDGTTRKIVN
jgi:hypothetical protein